jgi:hypothetical protein
MEKMLMEDTRRQVSLNLNHAYSYEPSLFCEFYTAFPTLIILPSRNKTEIYICMFRLPWETWFTICWLTGPPPPLGWSTEVTNTPG